MDLPRREVDTTHIPLDRIVADPRSQPRDEIDPLLVDEYSKSMLDAAGAALFPPIVVFFDSQTERYYIGDGHHRYWAATKSERPSFQVRSFDSEPGAGLRDAVVYSCGANHDHGKRRTNADKRRGVETLLYDAEWSSMSDTAIATKCRVSQTYVSKMRRSLIAAGEVESSPERMTARGVVKVAGGRKRGGGKSRKARNPVDAVVLEVDRAYSQFQAIRSISDDKKELIMGHFDKLLGEIRTAGES